MTWVHPAHWRCNHVFISVPMWQTTDHLSLQWRRRVNTPASLSSHVQGGMWASLSKHWDHSRECDNYLSVRHSDSSQAEPVTWEVKRRWRCHGFAISAACSVHCRLEIHCQTVKSYWFEAVWRMACCYSVLGFFFNRCLTKRLASTLSLWCSWFSIKANMI